MSERDCFSLPENRGLGCFVAESLSLRGKCVMKVTWRNGGVRGELAFTIP